MAARSSVFAKWTLGQVTGFSAAIGFDIGVTAVHYQNTGSIFPAPNKEYSNVQLPHSAVRDLDYGPEPYFNIARGNSESDEAVISYLGDEFEKAVHELKVSPPTKSEIESALNTMGQFNFPGVDEFKSKVSSDQIRDSVMNVINNENVIEAYKKNLEHYKSIASVPLPADLNAANEQWQELKEFYPCGICKDVQSAPVITKCEHVFCGQCVTDVIERCVSAECSEDEQVEVVHSCPVCDKEMNKFPTFQLSMDAAIYDKVMQVGSCPEKTAWMARYNSFHEARRRHMNSAKTKKDRKEKEEAAAEQRESYWSVFSELFTIAGQATVLALFVITLISIARRRQ